MDNRGDGLTHKDTPDLIRRWRELPQGSRQRELLAETIVTLNWGMLVALARRWPSVPHQHLLASATEGLWQAVVTFDPDTPGGAAWGPWLSQRVRSRINRDAREFVAPHLTPAAWEWRHRVLRWSVKLGTTNADRVFEAMAASDTDHRVSLASVQQVLSPHPGSLDEPIAQVDGLLDLADLVPDISGNAADPGEEVVRREEREQAAALIADLLRDVPLSPIEREVIVSLYGLEGQTPVRTVQDLGDRLAMSRQSASNHRNRALSKLRGACGLSPDDITIRPLDIALDRRRG